MLSITTLARLSGVKQETIRTWERRYGVIMPARDERGRRVYTDRDAQRLRLVAELVRAGHQIGEVASWSDTHCENMLSETDRRSVSRGRAEELREDLFEAIAADDAKRFEVLIGAAFTGLPPRNTVEEVVAPVLSRIGELWTAGELSIDQEHGFTFIVKRQILLALSYLAPSATGPSILISTLSGEHHELGALMACFVAASERYQCHYLGPNTPAIDLARAAERLKASAIAIGLVHVEDPSRYEAELKILAEHAPLKTRIILGVGAAAQPLAFAAPETVRIVETLDGFLAAVANA